MTWKIADAKNRLSELVNKVAEEGPQWIKRRDERYVVLTADEYEQLTGHRRSLKQMLLDGPSLEGVDLERDPSSMRDIQL